MKQLCAIPLFMRFILNKPYTMRKQDNLLHLIKTLSASEKRYFKLFCKTQTEGKRYLNLFNALEKTAIYDAKLIAEKLKTTPAALANDKEYLQEVLFRNLRLFHENSSLETKLQNDFMNMHLLHQKGLVQYAEILAKKLLEKAVKNELYLIAANTTRILSFIYKDLRQFDKVKAINLQEMELLETVTEYSAMIHLRDRLMEPVFTRQGFSGVTDIEEHELFNKDESKIKSNRARLCQNELKIFYYQYVKPDIQKALKYSVNQFKLFQKTPSLKNIIPSAYFNIQAKLSMLHYETGKNKEAFFYVNHLLSATEKNEANLSEKIITYQSNYAKSLKMTLLTLTHQFKEAAVFGKQIYNMKDKLSPDEKSTLLFDYALALFHTNNYDNCHEQLQELISLNTKERIDIQLNARLLFIMLQFQLKNYSIVAYQVKNMRAWKKRTKANADGADAFLSWLDKLGKSDAKNKIAETFAAFREELKTDSLKDLNKELALDVWILKNSKTSDRQKT